MGQEEPEPIKPEGEDPGAVFTEGDEGEASGQAAEAGPEPEGEDPGRIETFDFQPEGEERLDLSEEK